MLLEGINPSGALQALQCDATGRLVIYPVLGFAPVDLAVGVLAASATHNTLTITLASGLNYSSVSAIKSGVPSTGETLSIECSNNNILWLPTSARFQAAGLALNSTSADNMAVNGVITGRFLRLVYVNGLTGQTTLNLRLAILP